MIVKVLLSGPFKTILGFGQFVSAQYSSYIVFFPLNQKLAHIPSVGFYGLENLVFLVISIDLPCSGGI